MECSRGASQSRRGSWRPSGTQRGACARWKGCGTLRGWTPGRRGGALWLRREGGTAVRGRRGPLVHADVAYAGAASPGRAAVIALTTRAWGDGYEHVMRQALPHLEAGAPSAVRCAVEHALTAFAGADEYDTRIMAHGAHVRVRASDATGCYHASWGASASRLRRRCVQHCIRAGCAGSSTCALVPCARCGPPRPWWTREGRFCEGVYSFFGSVSS